MKKLFLYILGAAPLAAYASEAELPPDPKPVKFIESHHELSPSVKLLKHKEEGYDFEKVIGGLQYNFYRSSGLNFNSFFGYSVYKDKSYFTSDWKLNYTHNLNDQIDICPVIGMRNTSDFSTNTDREMFQIYRSTFDAGVTGVYKLPLQAEFALNLSWFKDLSTTLMMHKGDQFWGKYYYSPAGLKVGLDVRLLSLMSKAIEVGGFYAQTFKDCYKEYGLNSSVVFAF